MKNELKIGLVIADDMEYEDLITLMGDKLISANFYGRVGHSFEIKNGDRLIKIHSVLCGIGTVNAAAAAMYLAGEGADILLNYGLSGGISGVCRGDDVIGSTFMEYDFDLKCCGYSPCEKPSQKYIYTADDRLIKLLKSTGENKKVGKMASGDRFVSDPILRDELKNSFSISCCDMETSAIAYVADLTGIPFGSLRRVSDDAGEDATSDYKEMNNSTQSSLPAELLKAVQGIFGIESFWEGEKNSVK